MDIALREAMGALGMTDAFTDRADLSGISTQEHLFITGAQHKAFVAVDEKGTEAAAATGIGVGVTSLPPTFAVDRPFLFLIEDVETKSVLFLGRLLTP
jgi:serine protease inhibitor